MTRTKPLATIAIASATVVVYLLAWPTPVEPVAWKAPPPFDDARCRENDALRSAEVLVFDLPGPEAILVERDGALVTGLLDGRIVRITGHRAGETPVVETIAHTGGRPLGLKRGADGALKVADAHRGLLSVDERGAVTVLASGHDGVPFVFADDLVVARDGTIYFTDASARFSVEEWRSDVLEHGHTGRVLAYDPATRATRVLVDGLAFANGIALTEDERALVFTETTSYRLMRHFITGPRAGETEQMAELPGFPDNVTWSSSRRVFWIGLGSPRKAIVDVLAPYPLVRKIISRLPAPLLPKPTKMAMAIAVDEDGQFKHCLFHRSSDAYTPVASVVEHEGSLYLGSFARHGIARVAAP